MPSVVSRHDRGPEIEPRQIVAAIEDKSQDGSDPPLMPLQSLPTIFPVLLLCHIAFEDGSTDFHVGERAEMGYQAPDMAKFVTDRA